MNKRILIGIGIVVVVILVVSFVRYYEDKYRYEEFLNYIDYEVPMEFEKSKYGEYYSYYENNISCYFSVSNFSTYSSRSGKDYLEKYVAIYLSDDVSEVKEIELNGDVWYTFSKKNDGVVSYYYAIVKDDKGYYFEYRILDYNHGDYSDSENNFCKASYGEIVSSISLK